MAKMLGWGIQIHNYLVKWMDGEPARKHQNLTKVAETNGGIKS